MKHVCQGGLMDRMAIATKSEHVDGRWDMRNL